MTSPCTVRIAEWAFIVLPVLTAFAGAQTAVAQLPRQGQSVGQPLTADLRGFQTWLELARQHDPGRLDAAVEAHRAVNVDGFAEYEADMNALLLFIRQPNRRALRWSGKREYTTTEQAMLWSIAQREIQDGSAVGLLQKIALLLSDSIMLPGGRLYMEVPLGSRVPPDLSLMTDGVGLGRAVSSPGWQVARAVLAAIPPSPASLEWANHWYAATTAFLFKHSELGSLPSHLAQRRSLLGESADLLFDEGCLYEAHSDVRIQRVLEEGRNRDVSYPVANRRASLSRAQKLFEQAIALNGLHLEARLRLARVNWGLGNARQSVADLTALMPALQNNPELHYLAQLFLGASHEALGNVASAASAYGEAMRLYPLALAPLLSRIGLEQPSLGSDTSALERALRSDRQRIEDPWTNYYSGPGRHTEALTAALWRRASGE